VFALYILGSQLATLGVQFSVLRYVAEIHQDVRRSVTILSSALVVVLAGSTTLVALCVALLGAEHYIYSEDVVSSTPYMLPGLWAFAINKVYLNALNGARRNKLYALFTGARYALLALSVIVVVVVRVPANRLSMVLSVSEALLLLALAISCYRLFPGYFSAATSEWIRRHVQFGLHSILGGVAVELNTRVDVLVLGLFTSDAAVGIYSFAAFFVEGILQLSQLSRRIIDPMLTTLVLEGNRIKLRLFMRKGRNLSAIFIILVSAAAVSLYPFYGGLLGDADIAGKSWSVFAILMGGACVFGAYAVFGGFFSQAGLPLVQSHLNVLILVTNTILNLVLAPFYGIHGAATATAMSFVIGTLFFRRWVHQHFGFRL